MAKKRSGYYFPEELIFQILSWLPVLSLLRFRSVCKSWRSMISNPKFIENHLAISTKKEAYVMGFAPVRVDETGRIGEFNVFYVDTRDVSITLRRPPQLSKMRRFVNSCNGLVCLSNISASDMCLWNPLTRRFKKLPTPNIQLCFGTNLAFFFDSISCDYKLLRIINRASVLEVELYSTNADSWKEIQVPKSVQSYMPHLDSKFVHTRTGVLYLEGENKLLSFDLHNEVFGEYPFPSYADHIASNVLDFDGSVAMVFLSTSDGYVPSLWTLDDVCGGVAWVKKFRFEADCWTWMRRITLYLGAGQFVAQHKLGGGRYCFYDYKKNNTKQLPLPPRPRDFMIKYNESLVSLEGFEQLD